MRDDRHGALRRSFCIAIALIAAAGVSAGAAEGDRGLGGRVLGVSTPLPAASVYAYQIADATLHKAVTDADGAFRFDALPAGLYRVIAHKPGFVPAVAMLTRATADAAQFVELQLAAAERPDVVAPSDFWSARSAIPPDVLREIRIAEIESATRIAGLAHRDPVQAVRFSAEMAAMAGVDQIASNVESQVTGGQVGIEGRVGSMRLGLRGDFLQFEPDSAFHRPAGAGPGPSGGTSALSLEMAAGDATQVELTSRTDRLGGLDAGPAVDLEHYGVRVSQALGERSRSDFSAQYTAQSNFHRHGSLDPLAIPGSSQSWRLEGVYSTAISERMSLQTGVRYRELSADPLAEVFAERSLQQVDAYGRGGYRVAPAVLMEYGLYTALHDGSLSLIPRGGVVLQLSPEWQVSGLVSEKLHQGDGDPLLPDFLPMAFDERGACEHDEDSCAQIALSHRKSDVESFSLAATHREFGDTRRLYFSDDFLDRLDSLYLVPGDRVPELHMAASRQLTPNVIARVESTVGEGGGGTFHAADGLSFENRVGYLVTSVDTHFQGTATGLFVAFHRLRQDLEPIQGQVPAATPEPYDADRLEVVVTQNLNILLDLAADWALRLNMEVSRGGTFSDRRDDDLRKRLLGGIAIRF